MNNDQTCFLLKFGFFSKWRLDKTPTNVHYQADHLDATVPDF